MFFAWGRKHVYKKMGFVADFCPLCREVRSFQLDRIGLVGHVYYISLGKGELLGYARTCMNCKTVLNGNLDLYREVSKKLVEQGELQRTTFPNLHSHHSERLALEQSIKHSPGEVPNDTRHAILKEPFFLLNPSVEKRFSTTQIDGYTALTLLAVLVCMPFIFALGKQFSPAYQDEIVLGTLLAGVVAVSVQGFLQTGRYFESKIFPVLVPALKPLKPTKEEITSVISELKKAETKFGKKLKSASLLEHLQK